MRIMHPDLRPVVERLDPDAYRECLGCGHEYHRDSSPDPLLCWECDERRAEEAGW